MPRPILFFAAFCLLAVGCSKITDPEPLTPEEARRELEAQSIQSPSLFGFSSEGLFCLRFFSFGGII